MSPLQEYIAIIHLRQQDPVSKGERHHIIPRSCGGSNKKWNLVKLTSEEHLRCHRLLIDIYPTGKEHHAMCAAYHLMAMSRCREALNEDEAAEARRMFSESKIGCPPPPRAWKPGHVPWCAGKKLGPHTDEWKQKVSAKLTGRKHSDERRRKISEALRGKPKSAEAKKHMSENHADVSKRKDPTTGRFAKRE